MHCATQGLSKAALTVCLLLVLGCDQAQVQAASTTITNDPAAEFRVRSWTKEHGLPDNHVQAILQSRNGYLWIGTRRGLARFDGLKFTVFDHLNTPEMPNDNCKVLAEDLEGYLWIATDNGLLRWRDGTFKRFTRKDGLATWPARSKDIIGPIHRNRQGGVWVVSAGLDWIRGSTIRHFGKEQGMVSEVPSPFHEDSAGVLWTGGPILHHFDERTEKFKVEPESQRLSLNIRAIQDDGTGGLWLLCDRDRKGSWLYHFRNGQWERAWEFGSGFRGQFLIADRHGDLWTSSDGGLDRFHDGLFTRYPFPPEMTNEFVLCFLEDRNGNYWFGTEVGGLHCWKPRAISAYGPRDGLANDSTWTICEARDGSVWIGTEEGVTQFKEGRFRNFTQRDGLSGNQVRSVAEDTSGAIWVGTGSGLNIIRGGVVNQQPFPHKLELNKVRVVYPAKNGALWVGTVDGLFRLEDGRWATFTLAEGLAHADVRALGEDTAGNFWIGTFGGGLQSFHAGKFTTFTTTNGLSSNFVWALHEDADGVLWIGTERGLNRYESGRFAVFTTREGLPADLVNEILEDDFGNLWVSHDLGIYRVRKRELNDFAAGRTKSVRAVSYDESDGLPSNETNGQKSQPAGCKMRDGRLWFPTTKGVAVIDPKLCHEEETPPRLVIEQVRANGQLVFDNGPQSATTNVEFANIKSKIENLRSQCAFAPGSARVLEIHYTANTFIAPEKTRFKYRLEGLDKDWIDAGTRRSAYYANLNPGHYRFQVIAADHHGVWNETGAMFGFYLQPHFYQTWLFYVLCGATLLGSGWGVYRWRLGYVHAIHRLENQAALKEQQKRFARDIHDELGPSLTRIAQLSKTRTNELGQPMKDDASAERIAMLAEEAVNNIGEIVWSNNPKYDTLEDLVAHLREYAAGYLEGTPLATRFTFPDTVPQRTVSGPFRRHLLLILKEGLHNAVKHSGAGLIEVSVNLRDEQLALTVADNGLGIVEESAAANPRNGNGLINMRQRAAEIGGALVVQSPPGQGTKIVVTVDLPRL